MQDLGKRVPPHQTLSRALPRHLGGTSQWRTVGHACVLEALWKTSLRPPAPFLTARHKATAQCLPGREGGESFMGPGWTLTTAPTVLWGRCHTKACAAGPILRQSGAFTGPLSTTRDPSAVAVPPHPLCDMRQGTQSPTQ